MDRTKGIAGRLEGSFALSCLDLEAECPARARAGHQAYGASVRECMRVSLKEGLHPRSRDFAAWRKSRIRTTDTAMERPRRQAFRENYGIPGRK